MTKSEFMLLNEDQVNALLNEHGVEFEHLNVSVQRQVKRLAKEASQALPGDVAYDMAFYDKGASVARGIARAGELAKGRRDYLLREFANLLARKGVLS